MKQRRVQAGQCHSGDKIFMTKDFVTTHQVFQALILYVGKLSVLFWVHVRE